MTEIKNAVVSAGQKAQYDETAKRLLGQKIILAHILIKTVPEFKGMSPKEVVPLIEGTPMIGSVPVEPGLTNGKNGRNKEGNERLVGFNTENGEVNEGLVRFDIVFYVRTKDGLSQIIINCEAQQKKPLQYSILNRAGFYVSRLISSQKGRDFEKSNFNDILPVYSIWLLMNMEDNSLTHVHLTQDKLLGSYEPDGNMNMFNVILIGLSKELKEPEEEQELHRLLGVLFSAELDAEEKLGIMEREFEIPVEDEIRRDIDNMCNLSEGIWEAALLEGKAEGEAKALANMILQMRQKGFTPKEIANILDKEEAEVEAVLSGKEIVSV